eukprot:1395440-Amorphochlora_amoeboformis.AAC.2
MDDTKEARRSTSHHVVRTRGRNTCKMVLRRWLRFVSPRQPVRCPSALRCRAPESFSNEKYTSTRWLRELSSRVE